jgi:hypothetical protein
MSDTEKKRGKFGCFIGLFIALVFIGGMAYLFLFSMKRTEIYKCAVAEAAKNPKILEKIGAPVETGLLVWMDSYSSGRFTEEAHFNFALSGPKGSGRLYVRALKDIQYSSMELIFEKDGQQEIVQSGINLCK